MTPEQRALVDGAREKAAKARAYLDELVGDEDKDRTHRELLEVCDTLGSHTAAIRFYAPALCDLADEQEREIATLRETRKHMGNTLREAHAEFKTLSDAFTAVGFPRQEDELLVATFHRAWTWCFETAHKAQEAQGKVETERDALTARVSEQSEAIATLDAEGRNMEEQRDEARAADDESTGRLADLREEVEEERAAAFAAFTDGARAVAEECGIAAGIEVLVRDREEDHAAFEHALAEREGDLADEQASRIAALESERAADRSAFEHAIAEREGDLAHVKAELDALKTDVAARDAVGEQVARHFAEGEADRVLFIPSIQAALDVGLNGFGFKLVGETFVAALPRNPERRAIVVRFRAKGTLVDVEVRLAPVVEEGGAT